MFPDWKCHRIGNVHFSNSTLWKDICCGCFYSIYSKKTSTLKILLHKKSCLLPINGIQMSRQKVALRGKGLILIYQYTSLGILLAGFNYDNMSNYKNWLTSACSWNMTINVVYHIYSSSIVYVVFKFEPLTNLYLRSDMTYLPLFSNFVKISTM